MGPRPALPAEVATYDDYQRQRLLVKPGLTCYWQTRRNRDSITFDEWVDLDLWQGAGSHANHPNPRRFGHLGQTARHNTDGGVEWSCQGSVRAHAPMRSWPPPDARGGGRRVFRRSIRAWKTIGVWVRPPPRETLRRSVRFSSILSGKIALCSAISLSVLV